MPVLSNILIVAADRSLPAEVEAALGSLDGPRAVVHHAATLRQGLDQVRSRAPQIVVVELAENLATLTDFVEQAAAAAPEARIVAAFRREMFDSDISESGVLISALRLGVHDFLQRPVSSTELEELLRCAGRRTAATVAPQGALVSFISNKGGVGKSTLAVNAACGLAGRHPGRVLLVDASLQLGVCASMLDLHPETTLTDAVRERDRLDETLLRQLTMSHESGLHLLAAPRDAVEAADVDDDAIARILTLARRSYDYVLVDTFPMFDRVVVAVLDLSDRAFVVLESVVPTVLGAVRLLTLLDGLGFPPERAALIVNRFTRVGGSLRPRDIAARLGRNVDHVLPFDKRVIAAANTGRPFLLHDRRWWGPSVRLRRVIAEIEALPSSSAAHVGNGHVSPHVQQPSPSER